MMMMMMITTEKYECAMSQAVSCQALSVEAWVCSQASPSQISGGQSGSGTGSSTSISVSAVSIIPPMLHAHSFITANTV
jgi:hypothetical protein